jgi:hypothetical protein
MSTDNNNKSWYARHKVLTVIGVLVLLGLVGSAFAPKDSTGVSTTPASNAQAATPPKPAAKVGDVINVGGDKGLAITLTQVIDPATPASQYISPDAGTRYVSALITITNKGTASVKDDANNDVTLIGSDNQSQTSNFTPVAECTDFANGVFNIAGGASATGCVTFQVPNSTTPAKIQFTGNSGLSGDTAEWLAK